MVVGNHMVCGIVRFATAPTIYHQQAGKPGGEGCLVF